MPTPLNQSVADSALLTRTLPLGLLAETVRSTCPDGSITTELRSELKKLSRIPNLLVACNYGGTITPPVHGSVEPAPLDNAVVALRALAALPNTHSAVISGRSLRDLAAVSRLPGEVHLVGSHGSEFQMGHLHGLSDDDAAVVDSAARDLAERLSGHPGVLLQRKPTGITVHLAADAVTDVLESVRQIGDRYELYLTEDRHAVELSVLEPSKGHALEQLRSQLGVNAALFAGDAASDESALATLRGPDLGVRVGDGDSIADHRIPGPEGLAHLLALLFEMRRDWLFGENAVEIERHSMLGDGSSTALITPDAKICWMSHPLPESGSLFAHLLGGDPAGHFSVEPVAPSRVLGQRYVDNTMIVETRWANLSVTDYLEPSPDGITNLVRVLSGTGRARVVFAPRPDYANATFNMEVTGDAVHMVGTSDPIRLHAPGAEFTVTSDGRHATATAEVDLSAGPVVLTLRCGDTESYAPDPAGEPARRAAVAVACRRWVNSLSLPAVKPSLVSRSALVLRGLVHEPTGGVLAAATTSLPEGIGGTRNWDYRYCWLRDGSMTVQALVDLGSTAEAEGFLRWLDRIVAQSPGPEWLHPLYSVTGSPLATEATVESLPGYAGSRPVRIGNAADHQVQLDVFGPVADLIDTLTARTEDLSDFQWELLKQMASAVEARWHEPDHGIWEARRAPRHHVYTKVMCWVTIDRALSVARRHGRRPEPGWEMLAETIREEVLREGWDEEAQSYTVAYDSGDLDAAVLHIGLSGLLDPQDPRFHATVAAVERELRVGPTVFRYRYDDGLPGLEGGFHICTTWLIEAYLAASRYDDAEELFNRLVNLMGPTGLLPEEYDPATETHLGNHPQAYSHIGFIRCARLFDRHRSTRLAGPITQAMAVVR